MNIAHKQLDDNDAHAIIVNEDDDTRRRKKGFPKPNGTYRKYAAPRPPKQVRWDRITRSIVKWDHAYWSGNPVCVFDVDSNDMYALLSKDRVPPEDLKKLPDTQQAIRETLEVIRPFVVCGVGGGIPHRVTKYTDSECIGISSSSSSSSCCQLPETCALWSHEGPERELRRRGIKLAHSQIVALTHRNGVDILLGERAFHISFRYFIIVVLGGITASDMENPQSYDIEKPVLGYYIVTVPN